MTRSFPQMLFESWNAMQVEQPYFFKYFFVLHLLKNWDVIDIYCCLSLVLGFQPNDSIFVFVVKWSPHHHPPSNLITLHHLAAATAKPLQSCPTLCDPIGGSPPGSPIPGILQARTLEWAAISFSNVGKWKVKVNSLSCRILSDPMDCSPPGSSVHRIFQVRALEWVPS